VEGVERTAEHPATATPAGDDDGLDALVEEWRTLPDAADELGLEVTRLRQLLREGKLLAVRLSGGPLRVPAAFLHDGVVVKGLPGLITVLRDGRFDDAAAIRWLFTPDDSLPGRPVDALRENRGTEVKRRAQALGF
jgi:hypothetical protein